MFGWATRLWAVTVGTKGRDKVTGLGNFGEVVHDKVFRGAAPDEKHGHEQLEDLRDYYRVRTVLDLREDTRGNVEGLWSADLRMQYIRKPLSDRKAPDPRVVEECVALLKRARGGDDPPLYVHCQGGRDRTGLVVACFRIQSAWSFEQVWKEMRSYGYDDGWGHKPIGDFVKAYARARGLEVDDD